MTNVFSLEMLHGKSTDLAMNLQILIAGTSGQKFTTWKLTFHTIAKCHVFIEFILKGKTAATLATSDMKNVIRRYAFLGSNLNRWLIVINRGIFRHCILLFPSNVAVLLKQKNINMKQ